MDEHPGGDEVLLALTGTGKFVIWTCHFNIRT
jgi:hypothetical protein